MDGFINNFVKFDSNKENQTMSAMTQSIVQLSQHKFISLTTYRKNGDPVSTPVVFAEHKGKIYVITGRNTGKIKRLLMNPAVILTPCDQVGNPTGISFDGYVRVMSQQEGEAIRGKLRFSAPRLLMFLFNLRRDLQQGGNVYLEIII